MKEKSRGSNKYKDWRIKVLYRDKYRCVKCGNDKYLHCDHIIPWKGNENVRFDVENGQTLCAGCHLKKGREHNEIVNDVNTRFKKGICQFPDVNKGRIPWNKGKKGIQKAWNKGTTGLMAIPWNKGIPMREEIKKKVSEAKKGSPSPMKGKSHTEEAIKKNREAHLGKRLSPKTEFKKGLIPWNKGLKKEA